ncbi:uncharacterized protein LOC117315536 [Pecten maximus]|uniref:uncharacterized protein LOC117315536 n=1 Tax=Pecten maximus TaxID=6579 RepID=UPI001458209A|nr:uncharacterized protein LOC117315536 [Pecten maximus]
MAALNKDFFREAQPSELALFDLPPTQTAVENIYYQDVLPISQITSDSVVEFVVSGQNGLELIDLRNTLIYAKVKITKADGSAIGLAEDVAPINLFLPSLFSQVDVTLQGKTIVSTTGHYPYKAYINNLLQYGDETKKTQLTTQLWIQDKEGSMDQHSPRTGSNGSLLERAQMFEGGKVLDLVGPIYHDLFKMDRYLLNQVNVNVKLYRSKPSFCLLSGTAAPDYKVTFEDIRLRVSKVRVNPAVIYAQSQALEMTNAKYPFTQTMIKQMTIPIGATNFTYDNIFQGMRPNTVVVGFVNAAGTTGDYEENPWFFQPYDVTSIGLYVDGIPVGGTPLKLKYSATGGETTIPVLQNMLQSTGKWLNDSDSGIDRDDIAQGYALYTFELEPTFQTNQYLTLLKQGNVRLEVIIGTALTTVVSCIIYCEYPGYFEINAARDIVLP